MANSVNGKMAGVIPMALGAVGAVVLTLGGYVGYQAWQTPVVDPISGQPATPGLAAGSEAPPSAPSAPSGVAAGEATPQTPTTPEPSTEPSAEDVPRLPSFELVRIEADGATIIAGLAAPNSEIHLVLDGTDAAIVQADAMGNFVALMNVGVSDKPRVLELVSVLAGGVRMVAESSAIIQPSEPVRIGQAEISAPLVETLADTPTDAQPDATPEIALNSVAPDATASTDTVTAILADPIPDAPATSDLGQTEMAVLDAPVNVLPESGADTEVSVAQVAVPEIETGGVLDSTLGATLAEADILASAPASVPETQTTSGAAATLSVSSASQLPTTEVTEPVNPVPPVPAVSPTATSPQQPVQTVEDAQIADTPTAPLAQPTIAQPTIASEAVEAALVEGGEVLADIPTPTPTPTVTTAEGVSSTSELTDTTAKPEVAETGPETGATASVIDKGVETAPDTGSDALAQVTGELAQELTSESAPETPATPEIHGTPGASNTAFAAAMAEPAPPRVLLAGPGGITVLQAGGSGPSTLTSVTLDSITYNAAGEVQISGRGPGDGNIRVYLNNRPVRSTQITEQGQWRTPLPEVESGIYTLRVDELNADGSVASRVETPFLREDAAQLAAVAAEVAESVSSPNRPIVQAITVQPGSTLWAIALEKYGEGNMYVWVFNANRDVIRNPDLIYPGQVFTLPEE